MNTELSPSGSSIGLTHPARDHGSPLGKLPNTKSWSIAVLPGDGIGVEVMAEGQRVLRAVEVMLSGVSFQLAEYPVGAAEFVRNGSPFQETTFAACEQADAILLGAMGLPSVRWPDGKEMTPQIDLRERLDLYCGVRPIRL
jgi:3-isopropylmalate dehydrogenase